MSGAAVVSRPQTADRRSRFFFALTKTGRQPLLALAAHSLLKAQN